MSILKYDPACATAKVQNRSSSPWKIGISGMNKSWFIYNTLSTSSLVFRISKPWWTTSSGGRAPVVSIVKLTLFIFGRMLTSPGFPRSSAWKFSWIKMRRVCSENNVPFSWSHHHMSTPHSSQLEHYLTLHHIEEVYLDSFRRNFFFQKLDKKKKKRRVNMMCWDGEVYLPLRVSMSARFISMNGS